MSYFPWSQYPYAFIELKAPSANIQHWWKTSSSTGHVVAIILLLWAFVVLQNIRTAEFVIAAIGIKACYRENLRVEDKEMAALLRTRVSAQHIFVLKSGAKTGFPTLCLGAGGQMVENKELIY